MIKVIIEREIAEGLESFYEEAILRLLDVMTSAPGYISGESLVDIHHPNRYHVVTNWASEDAWQRWSGSSERQRLVDELRPFLLRDEKITLLRRQRFQEQRSAV